MILLSNSLHSGLVSYYKLDGNSNDSTNRSHGIDTGITYSVGNGKINQGAGYNTSSTITANGDILNYSKKASFSFWNISPDYLFPTYINKALSFDITYDGTFLYGLHIDFFDSVGNNARVRNSTLTFTPGIWSHAVITYDGNEILDSNKVKIYINGISSTVQVLGNISIPTNLNASVSDIKIGQNLNGAMDEVGIWNRKLSQNEVTELYNNGIGKQFPFN
jgi:hypothetical protein